MNLESQDGNLIVSVTDANIETELQHRGPLLLMFTATWCPPCQEMKPIISQLATEYAGKLKIVLADLDNTQKAATFYKVGGVPTIFVGQGGSGGKLVGHYVGTVDIQTLRNDVETAITSY